MKFKSLLKFVLVTIMMSAAAFAQHGKIIGTVLDAETGDPMIGCNVVVVGTTMGASTDLNGSFVIQKVPPGEYSLMATYISYNKKTVSGIKVVDNGVATVNIALQPEGIQGEEVVIEAKADLSNSSALLVQQKKSVVVSDAIGSEQISKTPDKSAGDALKRVTGLTVVGNKFVYVRGLGERYSNAQLNGIEIPSTEPEKKIIPMDIFPSGSIQNVTVVKTYNPDIAADFSGGLVKINTKEFPDKFYMAASVSSGINRASFSKILRYQGSGTDFLGFDDGQRKRPNVPGFNGTTPNDLKAQYNSKFQNIWMPIGHRVANNTGFSLSLGNSLGTASNFGYLASLTYSADFNQRTEKEFFPQADETAAYDYKTEKGSYSVLWGALLDVNAKINANNKIGIKSVYNVQSDDEASVTKGYLNASSGGDVRYTRLRYQQRALLSSQLLGEHQLNNILNSKIDWHFAYSQADRNEPDTRQTGYVLNETSNQYEAIGQSKNTRFFSDMVDKEINTGFDWSFPVAQFKGTKLKVGSLYRKKDRDFNAHRYAYSNIQDVVRTQEPEELFSSDNIANGLVNFEDNTQANDQYTAKENLIAGYLMADFPITSQLRFVGGFRYENVETELKSFDPLSGSANNSLSPKFNDNDLFPAINLIYGLNDRMNIRLGFSQTKARPQFRELAPFRYDDYRRSTYGNPFLKASDITNYDARWEFFPNPGELLAASFFYKQFSNPIEKFLLPNPGNPTGDPVPVNGGSANNLGLELELRASLAHVNQALNNFSATANVSFIYSRLKQKDDIKVYTLGSEGPTLFSADFVANQSRPMQGQSPYIFNFGLNYTNNETRTDVNLSYNVFGKRIAEIGTKLTTVNGEKIYDDVYEQSYNQLDLTVSQKLTKQFKLKTNWKNILNDEVVFKMGKYVTNQYKPGMSFSTSISYDF
ncbi:TonB-dependent receptor [bacterium]|nr:TonB-dependent receptor [bacterium]